MTTNHFPPSLVANLQNALAGRKGEEDDNGNVEDTKPTTEEGTNATSVHEPNKPIVLVTNCDGIESPGLVLLVEALVHDGKFDVHVCAPDSDYSASGHKVTIDQTVAVTTAEIEGATAFEVSGSPADCVSLALSGALFSWSKPALVISGINKGSACSQNIFYSGAIAGAREALARGVPSLAISLNWKKDESQESHFNDAVEVCLPLINAASRDILTGAFPKSCLLSMEIPTVPATNKGFKLTKQSLSRCGLSWLAVSKKRHPPTNQFIMPMQSLGMQLAQLGRDASAAGAARRFGGQQKAVESESAAAAGKPEKKEVAKKFFRLEFFEKEQEDADEDLDFKATANGFIAVTPLHLEPQLDTEIQASVSEWLSAALTSGDVAS